MGGRKLSTRLTSRYSIVFLYGATALLGPGPDYEVPR